MPVSEEFAHLSDLPLTIEVELDRRTMNVLELLSLDQGTVIKLTRSAGENIDIRVGGTLVGFGEIVIIEDLMGIRITDFNSEE
jgi:flagellar motor switch protein FliN/FliY